MPSSTYTYTPVSNSEADYLLLFVLALGRLLMRVD